MAELPTYLELQQRIAELEQKVAAQQHAETERQRTFDMMQAFMDNSPALIYIKDQDGKFIDINPLTEIHLQTSRESAKGKTVYDFFPKEIADKMHTDDIRAISGEQVAREIVFYHQEHPKIMVDHKFPLDG